MKRADLGFINGTCA